MLDLDVTTDGRRAAYFLELPREHVREPCGPLGPNIVAAAVQASLDMAERAGADLGAWLLERGLDRAALLSGTLVHWDDFRTLFEHVVARVGLAAFMDQCRQFAAYTKGALPFVAAQPDVESLYRFVSVDVAEAMWGPIGPTRVLAVRPGVLVVRLPIRAGLAGARALLESHAGTLESITTHLDMAPARARQVHLDPGAVGATYVIDVDEALSTSQASSASATSSRAAPPR